MDGTDDEFDKQKMAKAKEELREVYKKLSELEKPESYLDKKQIEAALKSYKKLLKGKKNLNEIQVLLNIFIEKMTVHKDHTVFTFKFDVLSMYGAVGGI